jgi:hypothetical protein
MEHLVKEGMPNRGELTDAAMAARRMRHAEQGAVPARGARLARRPARHAWKTMHKKTPSCAASVVGITRRTCRFFEFAFISGQTGLCQSCTGTATGFACKPVTPLAQCDERE